MFIANLLNTIVNGVIAFFSLLFRPFKTLADLLGPAKGFSIPPWLKYFMHLILVLAIVIGLYLVNHFTHFDKFVEGSKVLKNIFLPLLAILTYFAVLLFFYILRQLPSSSAEFPDIDAAIAEGLAACSDARIDIRDAPLFLVVGLPSEEESVFGKSSLISREISVAERGMPVRWFGDGNSLFVSIPGISALTKQREYSDKRVMASSSGGGGHSSAPPRPNEFATLGGGGAAPDNQATLQPDAIGGLARAAGMESARPPGHGGGEGGGRFATLEGSPGGSAFATLGGPGPAAAVAAPAQQSRGAIRRVSLDEKELAEKQIKYFVKRLREARYPVCPINGVLLVLPFDWTIDPDCTQLADTVKTDMAALQQTMGVKCACFTVFTGIERSPEFTEYVNRLEKKQTERRCGCGYPTPALYDPMGEDIESAHRWLVDYFERQVFELYQRRLGDPTNGKLFRFLHIFRNSKANFVRLLQHAFPQEVDEPFYLGGVYYAGTGMVGRVPLPFFDGVINKLQREHDDVIGWNNQALEEDARFARLSTVLYIVAMALALASGVLLIGKIFKLF